MFIYVKKGRKNISSRIRLETGQVILNILLCMYYGKAQVTAYYDTYYIINLIEMPCTGNNQWVKKGITDGLNVVNTMIKCGCIRLRALFFFFYFFFCTFFVLFDILISF